MQNLIKYYQYRKDKTLMYLDSIRKSFRKFPISLQVSLTDRCFNKCIMCGHWNRKNKMDINIDSFLEYLVHGQNNYLESVCYSGGDPFCYKKINKIMEKHIEIGMEFGFITAGYAPDYVDLSLLKRARFVRVSLDSLCNYSKIRGGIDGNLVVKSIDKMIENGVNVGIGITITKHNYLTVTEVFDYAISRDIKELRCWLVRHNENLLLDISKKNNFADMIMNYKNKFDEIGIDNNFDLLHNILYNGEFSFEFNYCKACLYQLFINSDGVVYPCCIIAGDTEDKNYGIQFGNINDNDYDSIWKNVIQFSNEKIKPKKCKECISRLSTINFFAENNWNNKNFI